jgi:hypothetical protein
MRGEQLVVLPAVGVHHRHDEVGAFLAQQVGLLLGGADRRPEAQVFRALATPWLPQCIKHCQELS